jgi:4-amino-4-deoxy-L-arabinose transferase-like glycosyltransferase
MTYTPEEARGAVVFLGGLLFIVAAIFRGWGDLRSLPRLHSFRVDRRVVVGLLLLTAAGFALRVERLDFDTLSHPEIYVPNIPLPAYISEPPFRSAPRDVLAFHFHDEPHPQGYYLATWLWTGLFGTSVWWLRLPSAILGAASIPFAYFAAARVLPSRAAWIAAALLAFNGHHIFWSHIARMYSMVCFLGLVGTWLLLTIIKRGPTAGNMAAYFAISWLGLFTDVLYWPFLVGHIAVCLLHAGWFRDLLFQLQMMVVMLGTPLAAHAVYRARPSPVPGPSWEFVRDFVSFGFPFRNELSPGDYWPRWALEGLLIFSVVLIAFARKQFTDTPLPPEDGKFRSSWKRMTMLFMLFGSVLVTLAFSHIAFRRNYEMALVSLLACAAFAASVFVHRLSVNHGRLNPLTIVSILPPLVALAFSYLMPITADRLFLIFVPFLLMLLAAGTAELWRYRLLVIPLAIVGVNVSSILYFRSQSGSVRDYKLLGTSIAAQLRPSDLILVHYRSWRTTPLFYYLGARSDQYISQDHAAGARKGSRVWLIQMDDEPPSSEMAVAVAGRHAVAKVSARGGAATLFEN